MTNNIGDNSVRIHTDQASLNNDNSLKEASFQRDDLQSSRSLIRSTFNSLSSYANRALELSHTYVIHPSWKYVKESAIEMKNDIEAMNQQRREYLDRTSKQDRIGEAIKGGVEFVSKVNKDLRNTNNKVNLINALLEVGSKLSLSVEEKKAEAVDLLKKSFPKLTLEHKEEILDRFENAMKAFIEERNLSLQRGEWTKAEANNQLLEVYNPLLPIMREFINETES